MIDKGPIELALEALSRGGVIAYPTETFYGLGARLDRPAALARLTAIKGRPEGKPLPVIAADQASAEALWAEVPEVARRLMDRFWPGPLTLVLPAQPFVPREVAPMGKVGVRVSSHPTARALAAAGPIAATSANLSGRPEVRKAEEIDPAIRARLDAVVDGGETAGGRPSTVVEIDRQGKATVLREGAVPSAEVIAALGTKASPAAAKRGGRRRRPPRS